MFFFLAKKNDYNWKWEMLNCKNKEKLNTECFVYSKGEKSLPIKIKFCKTI